MKKVRTFFTFCIVFCLCCSSAFALTPLRAFSPRSSASGAVDPAESVEESSETSIASKETAPDSETSLTDSEPEGIDAILKTIEDAGIFMMPGKLETFKAELKEELTSIADDFDRDISALKADLDKEKFGNKFFADLGLAFGYKDAVEFGFCGDIGMRFGKGLMFKLGGQYMVGNVDAVVGILKHDWSLSNATVQTTIGWEW